MESHRFMVMGFMGLIAMGYRTTIDVTNLTRDRLRAKKEGNETYDELVNRILDENERGTNE